MSYLDIDCFLTLYCQYYKFCRYGGFSFDVGGSEAYVNESNILAIIRAALPSASDIGEARDLADALEDLLNTVNIHKNIKVGGQFI